MSGEQEKRLVNHEVEASDLQAFRLGSVPCFTRKDLSQPELFSLFCMEKKNKHGFLLSITGNDEPTMALLPGNC